MSFWCYKSWIGVSCNKLRMAPVDGVTHRGAAAYGYSPNISSWGGSILFSNEDGAWHLFASKMRTGGLQKEGMMFISSASSSDCQCHSKGGLRSRVGGSAVRCL